MTHPTMTVKNDKLFMEAEVELKGKKLFINAELDYDFSDEEILFGDQVVDRRVSVIIEKVKAVEVCDFEGQMRKVPVNKFSKNWIDAIINVAQKYFEGNFDKIDEIFF